MFYVCEKEGKYYVATQVWAWAYENGAVKSPTPVASYKSKGEAYAAVREKNSNRFPVAPSPPIPSLAPNKPQPSRTNSPSAPPAPQPDKAAAESRPKRNLREMTDYVDPSTLYEGPSYSERIINKHKYTKTEYQPVYKSRDQVFQEAIRELCDRYLMHVKFKGGVAFITTVSGEWQFRYNDRPILLFHSNEFKSKRGGDLHNQNMRFYSPVDVIRYIRFHDRERAERLLSEEDENNEPV